MGSSATDVLLQEEQEAPWHAASSPLALAACAAHRRPPPTHESPPSVAPRRCVIDHELDIAAIQSYDASESSISLGGALKAARPFPRAVDRSSPPASCRHATSNDATHVGWDDKSHAGWLTLHSVYGIDWKLIGGCPADVCAAGIYGEAQARRRRARRKQRRARGNGRRARGGPGKVSTRQAVRVVRFAPRAHGCTIAFPCTVPPPQHTLSENLMPANACRCIVCPHDKALTGDAGALLLPRVAALVDRIRECGSGHRKLIVSALVCRHARHGSAACLFVG